MILGRLAVLLASVYLSSVMGTEVTPEIMYKGYIENKRVENSVDSEFENKPPVQEKTSKIIRLNASTTPSALTTTGSHLYVSYTIEFDDIEDVESADSELYLNGIKVAERVDNKGIFLGVWEFPFEVEVEKLKEVNQIVLKTKSFGDFEFEIGRQENIEKELINK